MSQPGWLDQRVYVGNIWKKTNPLISNSSELTNLQIKIIRIAIIQAIVIYIHNLYLSTHSLYS